MKKTGRKFYILFLLIALTLIIFSAGSCSGAEEENLLYNGDFEILDENGLPDGWFTDAYRMNPGYSVFSDVPGMEGADSHAVSIRNTAKNDARYAQTVSVEPETMYCLSGYIRAEGFQDGHGANLSIEGIYAFSEKVYDTNGEWQKIEYYGETGPDQYEITVFARVGGYSGESKGFAAFDRISLSECMETPDDVFADLWFRPDTYGNEDDEDEWESSGNGSEKTSGPFWPKLIVIALLYSLILIAVIYRFRNGNRLPGSCQDEERKIRIWPLMMLALLLRVVLSFFIEGYSVDVSCFTSWGYTMAHNGPSGFYQATSFCDYPPLYMYAAGLSSWITGLAGTEDGWTRVVFRMIPCLCDVAGCWMILKYLGKKEKANLYTAAVILLLAFNPATIVNSAAWGQMDSVLCLLLLAVAIFAAEGKWIHAIGFYVTAVLVKPQALMLGPLGLVFMILSAIRNKNELKKILTGTGVGIGLIVLFVLPFGIHQQPGWLISLYEKTLSSYPYATVNTANLYYLAGGNWNKVINPAHFSVPVFFAAACALHGLLWSCRNKSEKYWFIESVLACIFMLWFILCAALGLSWTHVGTGAMIYAFLIVVSMAVRNGNVRFLPYLGALLFILLYVFGVKMHERYLFPAFLLLALAWVMQKDKRILYLIVLFSATVFVNEGIVLDNSIRLGAELGHLNEDTVWIADILSVLNIAGAICAVLLGYDLMKGHVSADIKPLPGIIPVRKAETGRRAEDYHPDRRLHWSKKDTFILLAITILFSVVSLTTLGSAKAPQTSWSSSGEEEEIIFDLQEEHNDIRILYFGQVSQEHFTVEQSSDGETWTRETYAQMDQGQCWKWKYVTVSYDDGTGERNFYNSSDYIVHFSGRYIRLNARQVGLTLNEILFRDAEGNTIPATIMQRTGDVEESALHSDPENLLDEQDSMENLPGFFGQSQEGEIQPSWWNSTYFDEIYHARTGYEFTKGMVPYETSHPPLGKVFMSWSIMIFGMTPFGWRFAGALAGILMLPGIYLLARQLTKKTWIAAFACGLMALDCMHLTQTQIATIDSFPVLFIIYAFFFMLRFIQTDLLECSIKSAIIPLACSGLFMGLSIASKWIGIYAGIGLAILYFWHCFRNIRIDSQKEDHEGPDIFRRCGILSLWCVLFFVMIPAGIYLLSYIPYMAYNTRIANLMDYLNAVWRAQISMFNYHSTPGLGMDHPFYSPWWEWPIIGKPMFYATEQYIQKEAALHHSIFCFGNPVLWWGALAALPAAVFLWLREKHYQTEGCEDRWHLCSRSWDIRYEFVFVSLLVQYLPWVLVPRGTYIYHYFASVPFLIMILSVCIDRSGPKAERAMKITAAVILSLAAILFIVLLPYTTGMASPKGWLDLGKNILRIWY